MVNDPGTLPLQHGREKLEAALLRVQAPRGELAQVHAQNVHGRQRHVRRGGGPRRRALAPVVHALLLWLLLLPPAGGGRGERREGLGHLEVQAEHHLALPHAAPLPQALDDQGRLPLLRLLLVVVQRGDAAAPQDATATPRDRQERRGDRRGHRRHGVCGRRGLAAAVAGAEAGHLADVELVKLERVPAHPRAPVRPLAGQLEVERAGVLQDLAREGAEALADDLRVYVCR